MAYAENTDVSVAKSRAEIERLLNRHKCSKFLCGVDHLAHRATVQFQAHNRVIKFEIDLPNPNDPKWKEIKGQYVQRTAALQSMVDDAQATGTYDE